jgi:hypothetical protein
MQLSKKMYYFKIKFTIGFGEVKQRFGFRAALPEEQPIFLQARKMTGANPNTYCRSG